MAKRRKKTAPAPPVPMPASSAADQCPWLDPGVNGENLAIHEFPTFLILRLSNTTKHHVTRRYLDPFSITLPEWRLLSLIVRDTTMSFSELTRGSSMDKGQVSRTLQAIHRKGLVTLSGAQTGQRVRVTVTPKGQALFNEILPAAREHQARLIELMTPEERRVFHAVALRLADEVASGSFG